MFENLTKKILIISTGGTIAGIGEVGKTSQYKPAQLDVQDILKSIPDVSSIASICGMQMLNVESDDITTKDLIYLSHTINKLAQEQKYDGFVITHGTDTLEETAYFLNLTLKTHKPVVITGAMRPSTATSADGPQNLYQSIMIACNSKSEGKGVLVVFADAIYSGRDVTKISTQCTNGFSSRDFGALGYIHDEYIEFVSASNKQHTKSTPFFINSLIELENIPILYFHIDADPSILIHELSRHNAVVIAGAGNGCISKLWIDVLNNPDFKDKLVILTSRVSNGAVTKQKHYPDICISGRTLNPQKARILAQLSLQITNDLHQVDNYFKVF